MPEYTLVTACTPEYLKYLQYSLPTWPAKKQLKDKPLIIFYNGLQEKDFKWVYSYYKDVRLIEWKMSVCESKSELMFSAFIFGATYIKTPYYIKLDSDSFCRDERDILEEDDFNYDVVGHAWNYTKPGWFITKLDNDFYGKNEPIDKNELRRDHKRFASYFCLHKTEFMLKLIKLFETKTPVRLPVPSHDTTLWYFVDKLGKWKTKNMKRCGFDNCSRWKGLREQICISKTANNPFLNNELIHHVQLEVTSYCQLGCHNCDRCCGLAKTDEHMSLGQIWKFVDESIRLKRYWSRIDIIGGEPTYYPNLKEMFNYIKIYKDKFPRTKIRFSTNGFGPRVVAELEEVPKWVSIRNSGKTSKVQDFSAYNCAPIDQGIKEFRCCSVPWRCGFALTPNGYFLCGAGAGVARVFGINIGIKELKDATPENLLKQIPELCKYCGHSRVDTRHNTIKPEISPSWQKALENYQNIKMDKF